LRNGKLRSAGLKPGFIITRIDDVVVENPDHMMKVLKEKQGGVLVEGMYPNGARGYFALVSQRRKGLFCFGIVIF